MFTLWKETYFEISRLWKQAYCGNIHIVSSQDLSGTSLYSLSKSIKYLSLWRFEGPEIAPSWKIKTPEIEGSLIVTFRPLKLSKYVSFSFSVKHQKGSVYFRSLKCSTIAYVKSEKIMVLPYLIQKIGNLKIINLVNSTWKLGTWSIEKVPKEDLRGKAVNL